MFMTFKATRLEMTHASLSFNVALDPEMLHSAVSTLLQQPTFLMPSVLSETLNARVIATGYTAGHVQAMHSSISQSSSP